MFQWWFLFHFMSPDHLKSVHMFIFSNTLVSVINKNGLGHRTVLSGEVCVCVFKFVPWGEMRPFCEYTLWQWHVTGRTSPYGITLVSFFLTLKNIWAMKTCCMAEQCPSLSYWQALLWSIFTQLCVSMHGIFKGRWCCSHESYTGQKMSSAAFSLMHGWETGFKCILVWLCPGIRHNYNPTQYKGSQALSFLLSALSLHCFAAICAAFHLFCIPLSLVCIFLWISASPLHLFW